MAERKTKRVEEDFEEKHNDPDTADRPFGEVDDVPVTQALGPHNLHGGVIEQEPSALGNPYMTEEDRALDMTPEVVGPPAYASPDPLTSAGRLRTLGQHPLDEFISEDYGRDVRGVPSDPMETTHPGAPGGADLGEGGVTGLDTGSTDLTRDTGGNAAEGYNDMTREQLLKLASEREIDGRSSMNKDELVEAHEAFDKERETADNTND